MTMTEMGSAQNSRLTPGAIARYIVWSIQILRSGQELLEEQSR